MKRSKTKYHDTLYYLSILVAGIMFFFTRSILLSIITLIVIIALDAVVVSLKRNRKETKLRKSGIEEIDHMDGIQFEYFLATLFKRTGYKVKTTQSSSDYGADLVISKSGERTVIQAKRHMKKVGIKAIQEISAAKNFYQANNAWVVTNNFFTKPAIELAKTNGVQLLDRNKLVDLILKVNPGSIPNAKVVREHITPKNVHCPVCDSKMVVKEGKRGKFYGCSRWPSCHGTKSI